MCVLLDTLLTPFGPTLRGVKAGRTLHAYLLRCGPEFWGSAEMTLLTCT
jgi:hypothetical protein